MKKIFTLIFASILTLASASAQAIYQPGEHDNTVTAIINTTSDNLNKVPVEIWISNPTTAIRGFEAYFYFDDNTIIPWLYDEDEEEYVYEGNTARIRKSTPVKSFVCSETNEDHPSHFYLSVVDDRDMKLTEGKVISIFMDATLLDEGNHTLHILNPMCPQVNADLSSASYFCSNQDIDFSISNGGITIVSAVPAVNSRTISRSELYDLQGRKVGNTAKGLYISQGKKILM